MRRSRSSVAQGIGVRAAAAEGGSVCTGSSRRTLGHHTIIHTKPSAPVTMKAVFQPKASAIGGISSGVRIAPTFGAVFISPMPSERSLIGR